MKIRWTSIFVSLVDHLDREFLPKAGDVSEVSLTNDSNPGELTGYCDIIFDDGREFHGINKTCFHVVPNGPAETFDALSLAVDNGSKTVKQVMGETMRVLRGSADMDALAIAALASMLETIDAVLGQTPGLPEKLGYKDGDNNGFKATNT